MAVWDRNKVDSTQLNGGNEFDSNSQLALDEVNAVVNGGLYSQDFAEHLADAPDNTLANQVGTAEVEIVDNVVGGKTYKKFKFKNIKGTTGATGATGNGILSIAKTSTTGLVDTYTITFTSGSTTIFNVSNGKGISSITKTSTVGLIDTYTITYNDSSTSTFNVENADNIEMRYNVGNIQWKYVTGSTWTTLLSLDSTPTNGSVNAITSGSVYNHTSNVSNPHSVTKSQVGLSNAYNPTAYGGVSYGGGAGESGISFTDLNSLTFTGFYTCFGTTANVPSASYSWFIEHQNSNVGNVSATQIAIAYGTTTIIYKRNKTSSTWGAWENISPSLKVDKTTSGSLRRVYGVNASNAQELTEIENTPTASSTKLVTSGGIKTVLDTKANVNAPTNIAGTEQATAKFMTANGGSLTIGKEGPNNGTMLRFDQVDGTPRLLFRSSQSVGAMVWSQPEEGAKLFIDLGLAGSDYHRISMPATAGTLALISDLSSKVDKTTTGSVRRVYGVTASNTQELTEIKTTAIENSTDLITSGGVYTILGDIETLLAEV